MSVFKNQAKSSFLLFIVAHCFISMADAQQTGTRQARACELAVEYLAASDDDRRDELAAQLAEYDSFTDAVISKLSQQTHKPVEPGYYPEKNFSEPSLAKKRPDDLLYFHVPKTYRPDQPCGLIVFMHGGGAQSGRSWPHYCIRPLDKDEDDDDCSAMGHLFDAAGLIAVGPSAPWNRQSYYRWCLRNSDDYLTDVILECKHRYNIDPDRIILLGHSMGGFGAFHHVQRHPDRFAAVIAHAGSWHLGYWPVIRGTKLCFINGVRDAKKKPNGNGWYRWHYTDIAFARETDRLLTEQKLDYTFYEHPDGHDLSYGKPYIVKFLADSKDLRRDPYAPQIAVATPVGYSRYYSSPARHNRWLTMNTLTPGKIEFDELVTNDSDDRKFDDWKLEHRKSRREGSAVEAKNLGDNTIEVTTQHVSRFTVWLHPKMIDVNRPVRVIVDGETKFEDRVSPSLATALDSYHRRQDWGLIYPMKVVVDLDD
jgi:predicted esterase